MDRKAYWNDNYVKYWKKITSEANDKSSSQTYVKKLHEGDFKTAGEDAVFHTLSMLKYNAGEEVLDYGCGFGRLVPFFLEKKICYNGIDISEAMIAECKNQYKEIAKKFIVAEGESLPFKDNSFDKIVCYGVFDACYQEKALVEMFRVLKINGEILLTGKNTNYYEDDEQAYIAEEAARSKGHPNYFTDVKKMMDTIQLNGEGELGKQRFFLRRGDTGKELFVEEIPEKFYEWQIVITKKTEMKEFRKFSDVYSKTWKAKNKVK